MKTLRNLLIMAAALMMAACTGGPTIEVLSFNMRYDNPGDEFNSWQFRKESAAQLIRKQNADIVGTQEVLHHQLEALKQLLPEYTYVGVGRQDGKTTGEYATLMIRTERFDVKQSGNFWLSETPDVPGSKGWDAACERVATWAVLTDKLTKKPLFVINTHLDHMGQEARQKGVALLLEETTRLGSDMPVIITGDFNATPDSDVIARVLEHSNPGLKHTRAVASVTDGPEWTFHAYGRIIEEERDFIDYIFVSNDIKVLEHKVLPPKFNDQYVSDHAVVAAQVRLR